MKRKHLLLISSIVLMATFLFAVYGLSMHIVRPRGVAVISDSGTTAASVDVETMTLGLGDITNVENAITATTASVHITSSNLADIIHR